MNKMIARRVSKRSTQAMISGLRAAKLTVTRDGGGMYTCKLDGATLFAAMPGRRDYLIRMRADLFS